MLESSPNLMSDASPLCLALHRSPGVVGQYLRALARAPGRAQGRPSAGYLPRPIRAHLPDFHLEASAIQEYRKVCCFPDSASIPPTLLETPFQALMVEIVISPAFPFSPFGLIHLRQSIRSIRPIPLGDMGAHIDLTCTMNALRSTPRGYEADFAMEVRESGTLAWEGLATLLSRDLSHLDAKAPRTPQASDDEGWSEPTIVTVPADTGRRYAAVSGDYNPHHLHVLFARPMGFPRPIAHGMWTLARVLAHMEASMPLEQAGSIEAAFKRPVLLPGQIAIQTRICAEYREFRVTHPKQSHPHLIGKTL